MRKRISEQNNFPQFDLYKEYRKIEILMSERKTIGVYNNWGKFIKDYFTIEEYIEYVCFNNWNLRGTFTSIKEMREELGIAKTDLAIKSINEDIFLDFLQYVLNCIFRATQSMKHASQSLFSDDTIVTMLWDNIEKLVCKLQCKINFDKENQEFFILYNNSVAETVSANHSDIEESISEYNMIDNRGDLSRKAEILCTLYKKLESYASDFKGTTYEKLYDDTKFLFNKSGIRHNVEKDKIACETFLKMDKVMLEEWYDKIFNMFLSCMVVNTYLKNKPYIEDIKKGIKP